MPHVNEKIEEVKTCLTDVVKDINEILSMGQMTVPIVEGTIEKVKRRVTQIEKLFSNEEEKVR